MKQPGPAAWLLACVVLCSLLRENSETLDCGRWWYFLAPGRGGLWAWLLSSLKHGDTGGGFQFPVVLNPEFSVTKSHIPGFSSNLLIWHIFNCGASWEHPWLWCLLRFALFQLQSLPTDSSEVTLLVKGYKLGLWCSAKATFIFSPQKLVYYLFFWLEQKMTCTDFQIWVLINECVSPVPICACWERCNDRPESCQGIDKCISSF